MRSLNECRDEIFRRSRERIRKRKKAIKAAVLCVPLCGVLIMWPLMGSLNDKAEGSAPNEGLMNAQYEEGNLQSKLSRMEIITDEGDLVLSTGGSKAQKTENIITDILCRKGETDGSDTVEGGEEFSGNSSGKEKTKYTVIFYDGDMETGRYVLQGRVITDVNTGSTGELSSDDYKMLKEAAGLTKNQKE